jgi:hypothetical protein
MPMDDPVWRVVLGLIPSVLILGGIFWLLIWLTGDANVRAKPGCLVAMLVLLTFPVGLLLRLLVRPPPVKPPFPNPYDKADSN